MFFLQERDIYLFSGHGSGCQYVGDCIVRKANVRAASFLVGTCLVACFWLHVALVASCACVSVRLCVCSRVVNVFGCAWFRSCRL